jgi:hypothetical protein
MLIVLTTKTQGRIYWFPEDRKPMAYLLLPPNTGRPTMERIEYRDVRDKSKWPRGAWDSEPDKIQWPDEVTGMPCLIVRSPSGALCGYVGVSPDNKFYHMGYDDVDGKIEVHGGLTFADECQPNADEARHICQRPGPGAPDHVWWFGFDCAHAGDFCPAYERMSDLGIPTGWGGVVEYRDVEYVASQCAALATQLAKFNN